jgi:cysteine synthase
MKTTTLTKMIMAVAVVASSFTSCKKDKTPDLIKRTTATLSGAQEVPANSSTGTGTAQISYDPTAKTITYTMSWQLGSSTATTANMHFHGAEDGTDIKSSPVTIGITGFATGSSGTITGTTRALTDAEANQLLAEKVVSECAQLNYSGWRVKGKY